VLREDPEVVLSGELRDYETIQAAITVAETGHLVLATLHTGSTPETVDRIIDVFPGSQQNQIRSQLASVLRAVVAQRLIPSIDNKTRLPCLEILLNTPAIGSLIREGKIFMIDNIIETNESVGMLLFEKYLSRLYHDGKISKESALQYALRSVEIKRFIT